MPRKARLLARSLQVQDQCQANPCKADAKPEPAKGRGGGGLECGDGCEYASQYISHFIVSLSQQF